MNYSLLESNRFYNNMSKIDSIVIMRLIKESVDLKYQLFDISKVYEKLEALNKMLNKKFKFDIVTNFFIMNKVSLNKYIDTLARSFFGYHTLFHNTVDFEQNKEDKSTLDFLGVVISNVNPYQEYENINEIQEKLYNEMNMFFLKNESSVPKEEIYINKNKKYNFKFELFSSIKYDIGAKAFIYTLSMVVNINDKPYTINDPYDIIRFYYIMSKDMHLDEKASDESVEIFKEKIVPKKAYKMFREDIKYSYKKCKTYYKIRNKKS